jgi:hypothetical protein
MVLDRVKHTAMGLFPGRSKHERQYFERKEGQTAQDVAAKQELAQKEAYKSYLSSWYNRAKRLMFWREPKTYHQFVEKYWR